MISIRDRRNGCRAGSSNEMNALLSRATLASLAIVALAGCGSSPSANQPTGTPAPRAAAGATVAVAADPGGALKFTQDALTAKAGTVTFTFTNASQIPHAFQITGHGVDRATDLITGRDANLTATLTPGKYTFFCPVPGHRQAGMQGTLTVR
jgi:uncharacterized cupredoxin-like copper-binding protein